MKSFIRASAIAVGLALAVAGGAYAQQAAAPAAALTVVQIVQKLESMGYTAIEEIEKDDGVWEVEATNASGTRVELDVDPVDGRILRERPDHKHH
jgi:ABC-type sugar transport system substrate-binding protein